MKSNKLPMTPIFALLTIGFGVRLLAFFLIDFAFESDVWLFQLWGQRAHNYGFAALYTTDGFVDYPPGYMYVLYLLGMLGNFFDWDILHPTFNFFTFLPGILADLGIGFVLFQMFKNSKWGLIAAGAWVFNPSIILISSVWGQVESVFVLVLLVSLLLVQKKKLLIGYMLFGLAIMIKPQALFVAPIYLYSAPNARRKPYIPAVIAGICPKFLAKFTNTTFGSFSAKSATIKPVESLLPSLTTQSGSSGFAASA